MFLHQAIYLSASLTLTLPWRPPPPPGRSRPWSWYSPSKVYFFVASYKEYFYVPLSSQGHNMYKVERLRHEQNSILEFWKVSDFSKSCHQLHIFSSFQFCVIQFCLQFHKLATGQPKTCRVQMYVSFFILIRWKLNVQIHTYFYYRLLLKYYSAILFFFNLSNYFSVQPLYFSI